MHAETHAVTRIGWLRAAILGANDGIVSTASLIAGVAAAGASQSSILVTGAAGLVAGAMSMAAGEYVSVSSQGDAEKSDIELEKRHLAADPANRSKTSVCLSVAGADVDFIKKFAGLLEKEGAAFDIAGYRDAPPGLRIWCGATVDTADIEALGPWLDWAYETLSA